MEQKIETAIDNLLNSVAPQLYILSIIFGIIITILGIILIHRKSSKLKFNIGIFCVIIGILGSLFGTFQAFY